MAIATQRMTLAEYLESANETDTRYELENGELLEMPPESDLNQRIASFLFAFFLQQGVPAYRLRIGIEIVVSGRRPTARIPDLAILSEELATALEGARRSTVTVDMPPPELVVEVVSPGQEKRDYRYKRSEYAARGIVEYWIVDPGQQQVTILEWVEGLYEEEVYREQAELRSPLFGPLNLTITQLFQAR